MPGVMSDGDLLFSGYRGRGNTASMSSITSPLSPTSSTSSTFSNGSSSGTSSASNMSPSFGHHSLLGAMNSFVTAVDEMDGAVMIPCKLQDMKMDDKPEELLTQNGMVAPPTGETGPLPGGATEPPAVRNGKDLVPVTNGVAATASAAEASQPDLYTYYTMLNAIKDELVTGPPRRQPDQDEAEEEDGAGNDIARQTAAAFRHHLRGLFDVLRQMTTTADYLRTRYQADVGDTSLSSTRRLTHFTL